MNESTATAARVASDSQLLGDVQSAAGPQSTSADRAAVWALKVEREKAGAVMVILNLFFQQQRNQIAEVALKHRLPVGAGDPMYAEAGCLLSYGSGIADGFRRAAIYVDKIFKGAKPADLPVELPTRFELVINGKTAKALGLTIPQSLLISADKVIE